MTTSKRLTRSKSDKMLGGVCGGLGEYFGIDPTFVRLIFAALFFVGVGLPIIAYLLLWLIMPPADRVAGQLTVANDSLVTDAADMARAEADLVYDGEASAAATNDTVTSLPQTDVEQEEKTEVPA